MIWYLKEALFQTILGIESEKNSSYNNIVKYKREIKSRGENGSWIPPVTLTLYQSTLGVEKVKWIEKTQQLQRDREKPELEYL